MFGALFVIALLLGVFAFTIAKLEGLTFLGPKRTKAIAGSAAAYCAERCRADGRCPLTGTTEQSMTCPLWKFIEADEPTALYGSPFNPLQGA